MLHDTVWIWRSGPSRVRRDVKLLPSKVGIWLAIVAGFVGSADAFADTLPLETGKYVLSSVPCRKAQPSTSYYYDGLSLARTPTRLCRSRVKGGLRANSAVRMTCEARFERTETIRLVSTHNFTRVGGAGSLSYRLCQADPLILGRYGTR